MATDNQLLTVDIERRGYGRRYSSLPVDTRDRTSFSINCAGGYLKPAQYDLRIGDIVFWREQGRVLSGTISAVERDEHWIHVAVADLHPLAAETFHF